MSLRPVDGAGVRGDFRPCTVIKRWPEELPQHESFIWHKCPNDYLGELWEAVFQVSNGEYFTLHYSPKWRQWNKRLIELHTLFGSPMEAETLELALIGFSLTSQDIDTVVPYIRLKRHEVIRQDDYGNQSSMGIYPCRADAAKVMQEFTARGHKQGYWLREAPDEPTVYRLPKML